MKSEIYCDMGESFGLWRMGDDEAILPALLRPGGGLLLKILDGPEAQAAGRGVGLVGELEGLDHVEQLSPVVPGTGILWLVPDLGAAEEQCR